MVNTQLFQTSQGALLPAATARNAQLAPAYAFGPRHQLAQLAATGCLATLDGMQHAVAVEPMGRRAARPPELGRSVAIQHALQPRRHPAVDQAHRLARNVAFDVLGRQRPVGLRRGDSVQGGGGVAGS